MNTLSPRGSNWDKIILPSIENTEDFDSKAPNLNLLSKVNLNNERSRLKSLTNHGDSNNYNKSDGLMLDFEYKNLIQKLQTDASTDENDYSCTVRNKGDLGYTRIDAK